jgi:signal transduction histidine kinase
MKGKVRCMKHTAQILLVDDDVALLQALPQALSLRLDGVGVDTCDSAPEALKQIQEHEYDAIVSDIKMPGMDGLALLAKIQALRPETPTLLITGHGEHDLAIQALRGGAYDFIQKPIDRDYVVAALRRAIQTHQLRRQVRDHQRALELHAHALERVVQYRTQELVQANAVKDQFLGMVSHELSMPLTSLEGRVHLLRRQLDRADADDIVRLGLEDIERVIGRLEVLVTDLLDASLIETNRFVLHRKRCDLVELCRHVLAEYTAGEGPALRFEAPGEPIEAEVDPVRIGQALLNLLANARKYSPQGYPITVTLHQAGFEASISVRDRGVGIPAELLPHLFEPDYRVPGAQGQTGAQTGLGVGLYIAWKLVERHAGRIDVQSVPGEGSVFSMVLPLFVDPTTEKVDAAKLAPHTQAVWTIAPCG